MKTDTTPAPDSAVFPQTVSVAIEQLKRQLQCDYEQAYPGLREIIHLVLDEEERNARQLSMFPHLFLPDLVEEHIGKLNLQPVETKHDDLAAPRDYIDMKEIFQPAFAPCG